MGKELAAHTTLSHYRIVSKIGAGGMGEVYLAHDTAFDRKVALKILPADVASNQDRMQRFSTKVRREGFLALFDQIRSGVRFAAGRSALSSRLEEIRPDELNNK